ncbi:lysophospholipid acyltransferase family protein [Pontiella agarivorans]|uniref:Lysophospholipid acyltransferase family protein n=1 Tax=Pontiella agarivorans TaxID=3038953 RepID=A0ABU5N0Z9_9BACT|nr:lysophospholipid acyltransferase family protein [Pontiella agarivorans]MDZ8120120.1 lysophospholipid acyltransferase family protein [Pontiella agarivorans]
MVKVLLTFLLWLVGIMPLFAVRGLGAFIGFVFGNVIRHHRTDAFQALERSMPELSAGERKAIINRMYRLQGVHFVEFIWYSMKGLDRVSQVVEIEGREHADEAFSRGKGMIALTAHIGCFELMPMATAAQGYKLSTIVKKIKDEAVNEVIEKLRSHEGLTFLSSRNAYRDCLKALRRNEAVGMIIDQNMTRDQGIFVDFFGMPACTSPGLAYMAAQSQAPVVPVFIYRKPDGTFRLKVQPMLEPPADRSDEAVYAATRRYNAVIEDAVREAPEQWIWMHRRWNTKPLEGQEIRRRLKKQAG